MGSVVGVVDRRVTGGGVLSYAPPRPCPYFHIHFFRDGFSDGGSGGSGNIGIGGRWGRRGDGGG